MHKADLFSFKFGDICKNVLKPLFNQKMNENHHKSTSIPIPTLQKTTQEQGNIFMEWILIGVRPCWKNRVASYNDINDPVTGFHVA